MSGCPHAACDCAAGKEPSARPTADEREKRISAGLRVVPRSGRVQQRAGRMFGPAVPGPDTAPSAPLRPVPPGIRRTTARGFRGAPPVVVVVSPEAPLASAARLATRAAASGVAVGNAGAPVRVRAVWVFPVVAVVIVVGLTWMDVGVLRADKAEAQAPAPPSTVPLRSR